MEAEDLKAAVDDDKVSPNESEDSVPAGWRIAQDEKIISPSGETFRSRREAFQALCSRESSPVEERVEMFDCLVYENFQASHLLPLGWVFQCDGSDVTFLSSDGVFLPSEREADTYFQAHSRPGEYEMFLRLLTDITTSGQSLLHLSLSEY